MANNDDAVTLGELLSAIQEDSIMSSLNGYAFFELAKHRKIFLEGEVDIDSLLIVKMILKWNIEDIGKPIEERDPIWIYILNYGGEIYPMWSLIDAIMASDTPVYTVNLGITASAAANIFMAGTKRFMTRSSTLMIHEGAADMSGDAIKLRDFMESYNDDLQKMHNYILSRTEIPAKLLNKKRNNDWTLTADDCLKYHVVDTVIEKLSEVI